MTGWRGLHEQDYHSPWLDGSALCTICQQDCEADDVCYCCQRNAEVERLRAEVERLTAQLDAVERVLAAYDWFEFDLIRAALRGESDE